jgi:hypothetical protein
MRTERNTSIRKYSLAELLILGENRGMSMNAVNPERKLPRLGPESRVLRRGVLGDQIDGRSREGRFLLKCESELVAHVGGSPSFTQRLLIRRLARAMLRLELLDEKMATGELSAHDARTFSALSNVVRLTARELGVQAAASVEKPPTLDDYLASKGSAR